MSFGRDYNVHWGYLNRGDDNIQKVNERLKSHSLCSF